MNFLTSLFQNVRTTVVNTQNRNARRQAIHSALLSVNSTHAEYTGVGFDEHFMANGAAEIMESFLHSGQVPTPNTLTTLWAAQFQYSGPTAQKAIANIMPMVTDFVNVLTSETAAIPVEEEPLVEEPVAAPAAFTIGSPEFNLA